MPMESSASQHVKMTEIFKCFYAFAVYVHAFLMIDIGIQALPLSLKLDFLLIAI